MDVIIFNTFHKLRVAVFKYSWRILLEWISKWID